MSDYFEYIICRKSKLLGTLFVIFQKVAVHEGRRYRVIFSVRHHTRIVLEGDQSLSVVRDGEAREAGILLQE